MNAAQSKGLSALSQGLERSDQNDRNLAYTAQIAANKEKKDKEQEEAQIQEQQYYQHLNQQAEGLLSGDRKAINTKARAVQNEIKEQIRLYGGDRKRFMQNGGHSLLGGYINKIAASEEMMIYKENKENIVRIMDAEKNHLGHLILDKDRTSMQQHQKNGKGKITYSGLMQEVEIPPQENYDLGANIPLSDIVSHESNSMRIMANYKMNHPDRPFPPKEDELLAFAHKMGYGGKGSNRDKIDYARKLALEAYKKKLNTPKAAAADKRKIYMTTKYSKAISQMPQGKTAGELYGDLDSVENTNWFKAQTDNELIQNLGMGNWSLKGRRKNLDEEGLDLSTPGTFQSDYQLAHSGEIFKLQTNKLATLGLKSQVDENGYVEFEPSEEDFSMVGQQVTGSHKLEPGEYKAKYKVVGMSTAFKIKDNSGGNRLLMSVHDQDGELNKEDTKEYAEAMKYAEVAPTTVIAVQHPDGEVFYREMNLFDMGVNNTVHNSLGPDDDITDVTESQQREYELQNVSEKISAQQQAQSRQQIAQEDMKLSGNAFFQEEANDFAHPDNPNVNRSTLMKAFYMNNTEAANQNLFSQVVAGTGREAEELFRDFSLSDEQVLNKWLTLANQNESDVVKQNNLSVATQWMQALQEYNKIYNE